MSKIGKCFRLHVEIFFDVALGGGHWGGCHPGSAESVSLFRNIRATRNLSSASYFGNTGFLCDLSLIHI